MPQRIHLTPAKDTKRGGVLLVPWPVGTPKAGRCLPDEGAFVLLTTYWRRRIADGSVVVTEPQES